MSFQIVEIKINDARRKVLLQDSLPLYYPNLYVTCDMPNRSINTQRLHLNHIITFEAFLAYESIDLVARLKARPISNYLTDNELARWVSDAELTKKTLDKKYAGIKLVSSGYERVGGAHVFQRIDGVRDYLEFLYDKLGDSGTRNTAIKDVNARIKRKIKAASPAWNKTILDTMKGLTDKERQCLLEFMHPKCSLNPFQTDALRWRNYIVLLLGLELGLRRSEMLLMKISDIKWGDQQIEVVDLPSGLVDPRKEAPQFKTHERRLPLSDDLSTALVTYLETFRASNRQTVKANKHPFLLVSIRDGKPLSLSGLEQVFTNLGEGFPELRHITPHTLRHDAVYTLLASMSEELEAQTPEDRSTQVQKVLTWAFGWSPESDMPRLYGAKFWHEEADKAMRSRADKLKLNFVKTTDEEGAE